MDERYGVDGSQTIADATWINDLSPDEVALTSDRKIGKVTLQSDAIRRVAARILVVGANMTAPDQAARFIDSHARIEALAARRNGPWVVSVGMEALRDLRMSGPAG